MSDFTDADRAAIATQADLASAAMNQGDFQGWIDALWAPDATVLPPGSPPVHGHAAALEFLEAFPAFQNFVLNQVSVDGVGDLAYVRGSYSMDFVDESGAVASSDQGSYIEIWRKTDDGWRVTDDIFNSDLAEDH